MKKRIFRGRVNCKKLWPRAGAMVIVCPLSLYCPSAIPSPMVMVNGKTQAASGSSVPVGLRAWVGFVGRVLRARHRLKRAVRLKGPRSAGQAWKWLTWIIRIAFVVFQTLKEMNRERNFFGGTSYWILEEIVFYDTWIIHRTYLLDW